MLGKIYHVRNVIGRENLITCGRTNEFALALLTEYTRSVAKALWLTERDWRELDYMWARNISPPITLQKRQFAVQHRKFLASSTQ